MAASLTLAAGPFRDGLLEFVNTRILGGTTQATAQTALFEDGLVNSIKILDLIAYVEKALGAKIPEKYMVMKHFRSVNDITSTFAKA